MTRTFHIATINGFQSVQQRLSDGTWKGLSTQFPEFWGIDRNEMIARLACILPREDGDYEITVPW